MTQHATSSWMKLMLGALAGALLAALLAGAGIAADRAWAATATLATGDTTVTQPADDTVTAQPAGDTTIAQPAGDISVHYQAKVQKKGWLAEVSGNTVAGTTGEALKMKGLKVKVSAGTYTGTVLYRAHFSTGAWSGWKKDGAALTTSGYIDAVQIALGGTIANDYDIVYRAHVQDIGWQRRMRNGETAGVAGSGKRVEALCIDLVSKSARSGWIGNGDGTWSYYEAGKPLANRWIVTDEHPIETSGSGLQRYWVATDGILAVNRYVTPDQAIDSGAGWTAYATSAGYVARGKFTNGDGLLLANNDDGRLYTTTRWLTTKAFDGKKQKYRLVKKGPAAVVQTGLFKVGKKKYYGWEDGSGYILRSKLWYVGKSWYKANSKGVLKKYKGKTTKLIDRYVKWAVKIAKNDSHGYSQANRWGPDYDCSSLVCTALAKTGFPKSGATWTGNMKSRLKKIGFKWHKGTKGLRRGDIMLVHTNWRQHTEIYIGNNQLVGAHIAETGGVTGKTGDQTGNEISVTQYYNAPWQGYLRYKG